MDTLFFVAMNMRVLRYLQYFFSVTFLFLFSLMYETESETVLFIVRWGHQDPKFR